MLDIQLKQLKTVLLLIFIFNPLAGILLLCYFAWNMEKNMHLIRVLAVMLAIFLAFVNATKIPISDMERYKELFLQVPNNSLFSYMVEFGKEPVYSMFTYSSYYCLGGSWTLYVILFTLIYYLLIFYCIITVGREYSCSASSIIVTLIVYSFFFQIFTMTGHLIRQCLAESLFVLFLIRKFVQKKSSWWIALISLGIHSTILPLIGITLLPQIKQTLTIKGTIKSLILIIALGTLFIASESLFRSVPFIGNLYSRSESEKLLTADSWQIKSGVDITGIIFLLVIALAIVVIKRRKMPKRIMAKVTPILQSCLFLIVLLFVFIALKADYLSLRYFFYMYSFLGLILVLFLYNKNNIEFFFLKILLIPLCVCYFLYGIDASIQPFGVSAIDISCLPLFLYF